MERSHSPQYLETFDRARKSNLFCDAILITTEGERFNVHKCVLLACSPYFMSLFSPSKLCANTTNEYLVSSFNKKTLGEVINYAYTRHIKLDLNNIDDILSIGNQYKITSLTKDCCNFLNSVMNSENCSHILKLCKYFRLEELEESTQKFLERNFAALVEGSRDIIQLPYEDLISILNSDDLNAPDEARVWETVVRWIDWDAKVRKRHIFQLMKCVRLGLLDRRYFCKEVRNHAYVVGNADCCTLARRVASFFKEKNSMSVKVGPEFARPRIPYELIFAIGGGNGSGITDSIEVYDVRANCWIEMFDTDINGPRTCHGSVAVGSNIYIIGGEDGHSCLSDCRCFNTVAKIWKAAGNMHYKRGGLTVSALDGVIYAVGGHDGVCYLDSAEKYDEKRNQWTVVASMRYARSEASSAALCRCLYVVGGYNNEGWLSSVECYSPLTNEWTEIMPMSVNRRGHCCVAYDGFLYILGGLSGGTCVSTVEKYGPHTMSWSQAKNMLSERSYFSAEVLEDKIFVVGGYCNRDSATVEYYDETLNMWFRAASMNFPRSTLSTCLIRDIPNIGDYIAMR